MSVQELSVGEKGEEVKDGKEERERERVDVGYRGNRCLIEEKEG